MVHPAWILIAGATSGHTQTFLPPTPTTRGGVFFGSAPSIQFQTGVDTSGVVTFGGVNGVPASLMTVTQSVAGATDRSFYDRDLDIVSVRDFGAQCDAYPGNTSPTDDTAALNIATSALGTTATLANGNKRFISSLLFPGPCLVSGQVSVSRPGTLYARPYSGDGLVTSSATADVISSTADFLSIQGLTFNTTVARIGGAYVRSAPVNSGASGRIEITDNTLYDPFNGFDFEAGSSVVHVSHNRAFFFAQSPTPGGAAIVFNTSAGNLDQNVSWFDAFANPSRRPSYGVLIYRGGDIAIDNSNFDQFDKGLYAQVGQGDSLTSLRSLKTYYDSSGTHGVELFANGGSILRSDFVQSWSSSSQSGDGIYAHTANGGSINGLDIVQHHSFGNHSNGVDFADRGVTNAHVIGGEFAGNGGCGVNNGPNQGFMMMGATSGSTGGFGNNAYGVCVAASATDFRVIGNDFRGNSSAALVSPIAQPAQVVENNIGYDRGCTAFNPTITSQTGTISVLGAVSACYRVSGKLLYVQEEITVTTNGTAGTNITSTLPPGFASARNQVIAGRSISGGKALAAQFAASAANMTIQNYDNSYPAGDGTHLVVSGTIEVQ